MKSSSNLAAWLNKLENLHPKAMELGLDRIQAVAERLSLIKPWPYVITVAGTNGKGSCVALLEALFKRAGKRVGTYTSPHLIRYNERIKIDGLAVSDAALCQAFAGIDEARGTTSLTYFEYGTLAALWLFKQQDLDVIVLEVGLGGRLDAVNCIDADLAIISGVDFDHMDYLGTTREAIGYEKAGIIRSYKPLVYGDEPIPNSVLKLAEHLQAPVYRYGKDYAYKVHTNHWEWRSEQCSLSNMALPILAVPNVATILMAHELLPAKLQLSHADLSRCLIQVYDIA
jgi:dihydrofolate synthase/folylpolyglutamate synthase